MKSVIMKLNYDDSRVIDCLYSIGLGGGGG